MNHYLACLAFLLATSALAPLSLQDRSVASLLVDERQRGEERTVIEITQGSKAQAAVGDIIRVTGRIAAGQGSVSVAVKGPGKLVATNLVRQLSNGRPLLGSSLKEFEIRAESAGEIAITVTVNNTIQRTRDEKEYTVEVK